MQQGREQSAHIDYTELWLALVEAITKTLVPPTAAKASPGSGLATQAGLTWDTFAQDLKKEHGRGGKRQVHNKREWNDLLDTLNDFKLVQVRAGIGGADATDEDEVWALDVNSALDVNWTRPTSERSRPTSEHRPRTERAEVHPCPVVGDDGKRCNGFLSATKPFCFYCNTLAPGAWACIGCDGIRSGTLDECSWPRCPKDGRPRGLKRTSPAATPASMHLFLMNTW